MAWYVVDIESHIKENKNNEFKKEMNETLNIWSLALQLAILMGVPIERKKLLKICKEYKTCEDTVEDAFQLRTEIESDYLNRPFAANDPLYELSSKNKDAAKLARARLREKEICDVLKDKLQIPELIALGKYVGLRDPNLKSFSKSGLCKLITRQISQGGTR